MSGRQINVWDLDDSSSRSDPVLAEFAAGDYLLPRHPSLFTRWAISRARMEARLERHTPDGPRGIRRWEMFDNALRKFGWGLWCAGVYERGMRNALDVRVNRIELAFDNLPAAFDGYTVLHLADLHIDALPALPERLRALLAPEPVDLCVMTGDYRFKKRGPFAHVIDRIGSVLEAVDAADGVLATLGNHDSVEMVEPFETIGVRVLANETTTIARKGGAISITGVDDVHYYFTDHAHHALAAAPEGFRIGLVHSPEFAQAAAESGVSLYLTGHTHGGQVCLPGGRPFIRNLTRHREYCSGLWRHGEMVGYTSMGAGVSGLPVRYNSRGEVTLFVLRSATD